MTSTMQYPEDSTPERDSKSHLNYRKALELVDLLTNEHRAIHFNSIGALQGYIGCENAATLLRILRQLEQEYGIKAMYDDTGVTLVNIRSNSR